MLLYWNQETLKWFFEPLYLCRDRLVDNIPESFGDLDCIFTPAWANVSHLCLTLSISVFLHLPSEIWDLGNPADNPVNHSCPQDSHQSQNLHHPESLKASSTTMKLLTSCHLDANKVVPPTPTTHPTPVPMLHGKDNLMVQIQHIWSTPCQIWPLHQHVGCIYASKPFNSSLIYYQGLLSLQFYYQTSKTTKIYFFYFSCIFADIVSMSFVFSMLHVVRRFAPFASIATFAWASHTTIDRLHYVRISVLIPMITV